jgi:hypothetical protein
MNRPSTPSTSSVQSNFSAANPLNESTTSRPSSSNRSVFSSTFYTPRGAVSPHSFSPPHQETPFILNHKLHSDSKDDVETENYDEGLKDEDISKEKLEGFFFYFVNFYL